MMNYLKWEKKSFRNKFVPIMILLAYSKILFL